MNSSTIVGVWKLVSFEFRKENGEVTYPFGREARGTFIYTEGGRFSIQLMRKDRPKFAVRDQFQGTPEETESAYKGSISYFGTYEVDEKNAVILHQVEGSLFPNMEGSLQKRFFEVNETQLELRTPTFKVGGEIVTGIIQWKRFE